MGDATISCINKTWTQKHQRTIYYEEALCRRLPGSEKAENLTSLRDSFLQLLCDLRSPSQASLNPIKTDLLMVISSLFGLLKTCKLPRGLSEP